MSKLLLESDLGLEQSQGPDAPTPRLDPGFRIAGKYEVRAALGSGAFAVVYEALDTSRDARVAIKVLHIDADTPRGLVERFRREARLSKSVRHRHVLEVYETGTLDDGSPFLVMERLVGETLAARIARTQLSIAQVIELGCQLLRAVEAIADADIVHRDIKPENVMLHESGEGAPTVKLVDFGISKRVAIEPGPRLTSHGALVGTPQYMAPEQIRGEEVDVRTDLYAVGAVLYEALSGKAPHESKNFSELVVAVLGAPVAPIRHARPDCPFELEHVILRALARTPQDRHGSPREFLDAIAHVARTYGLAQGEDAFRPGDLDIGAITVAGSATMRSSIVATWDRLSARLGRRRPLQIGLTAAVLGAPALALHLYGSPWFESSERVLAQRGPAALEPSQARQGAGGHDEGSPATAAERALPQVAAEQPIAPQPVVPSENAEVASTTSEPAVRAAKQAVAPSAEEAPPAKEAVAAKAAAPAVAPQVEASAPQAKPSAPPLLSTEAVVEAQPAHPGNAASDQPAKEPNAALAVVAALRPDDQAAPSVDAASAKSADLPLEQVEDEVGPTIVPAEVASQAEADASARSGPMPKRSYKQVMEAALAALVRGRLAEAAVRYNEAVRLDPKEPSGFRGLGLVAARLGNYAGARWALSRYLALAPKAADAPAIAARIQALPR